jgi:predicted cobalt transporter CbtA
MSTSERVICASCGANNFATQAACWKCGKGLNTISSAPPPSSASSSPLNAGLPAPNSVYVERASANDYISPSNATAAAVVLGLLFPTFAIPVGIVFLMLDNKRKTAIGWQNIIWGTVGFTIHFIVTMVSLAPLVPMFNMLSKGLSARPQQMQQQANPFSGE